MGDSKYAHLSREELIARLQQLDPEVKSDPTRGTKRRHRDGEDESSKDAVAQKDSEEGAGAGAGAGAGERTKKLKKDSGFDFESYGTRTMAFRLMYFGWNYDGFASQDHTENTIEGHLFKSLITAKLVKDKDSCGFTRCGRTDKGVSSFGQVRSPPPPPPNGPVG